MRRRELLAGLAGLGLVGAAASYGGVGVDGIADDRRFDPVVLPRIDAPGSPPGEETIPEAGRVTFAELFATWCGVCQSNMAHLSGAVTRLDDDVQFVSVTNEPVGETISRDAVADWWREHDGRWPVAHDDDLELTRRLDATSVPFAAVFDAENELVWTASGYKETDEVLDAIRSAR